MGGAFVNGGSIAGVELFPLKRIADERGAVMHMLRSDAPHFPGFGEVYFSLTHPRKIKAWKRHTRVTQVVAVPIGEALFVLYDARDGSPTRGRAERVALGESNYRLLRIPPLVWYGFTAVGETSALIASCIDEPHDPAEGERLPEDAPLVPFHWSEVFP